MAVENLQTIKQSNRATVLNFIRQQEPVSRSDIARDLSLSPTTASAAVSDLIDSGLVREVGMGASTGGRRPILLEINPKGGTVISVDVSGVYRGRIIRAAALDLKSDILTEVMREQEVEGNEGMLTTVSNIIHDLIASPDVELREAVAIGISVPGLVNATRGELVFANMNISRLALGPSLAREFQAPVLVLNSEDAAALGEYRFGAGRGCHSLLYLSVGSGTGIGLVVDGRIYQRGRTSAGEMGHVTLQPDGPLCRCGNRGCFSALVSSEALVERVQSVLAASNGPGAADLSPDNLDVPQIMRAAQAGQTHCLEAVTDAAGWVGQALGNLINLLNPEVIALGGELFEEDEFFFSVVQPIARQRTLKDYVPGVQLVRSSLGRRAGLQGVALLALDKLLDSSTV
ncbi:MAG TPA: ROK family transcriptional regulator [Candidatus Sulfomarinibacteraceae bacterium]|nr:ROK family transcriptional regulator [Candidatus Sulfomarinibacteraceae bacterium]